MVSNVWKGASYVNEGGEGGTNLSEFVRYLVESLESEKLRLENNTIPHRTHGS